MSTPSTSKVVEIIEKALPAVVSAGVIGLFSMTLTFWSLRTEVTFLREDVAELKGQVRTLIERQIYHHGDEVVAGLKVAQKEKR